MYNEIGVIAGTGNGLVSGTRLGIGVCLDERPQRGAERRAPGSAADGHRFELELVADIHRVQQPPRKRVPNQPET